MAAGKARKHTFVSTVSALRDRWMAAFPGAGLVTPNQDFDDEVDVIWVHLLPGKPVSRQISEWVQKAKSASVIGISDVPNDLEGMTALTAGAKGYCNANSVPDILRRAAIVVQDGGVWIGMSLMQRMLNAVSRLPNSTEPLIAPKWGESLTAREREVALEVAAAASNKEIARKLGVTERTVKAHVTAIFSKLQVRDRMQLSLKIRGQSVS